MAAEYYSYQNAFDSQTSGVIKAEDVDFISAWLRAKYANSIRETKKGAEDRDFELLGEKFHNWVRLNARTEMQLTQPKQYKELVTIEMSLMTSLYLRIKAYSDKLTPGYEAVFYNAHRDITYQNYFILASVRVDDSPEVVDQKIKLVSTFIDIFASTRIFNYKKINWNSNKSLLFRVLCQIRNQDAKTIGIKLFSTLQRMNEKLDAIKDFELKQFTGRYMLHMLARLTDYVNVQMGRASQFATYVDRNPKASYDVEHILPDDYASYKDMFNDEEDFNNNRRKFGNLILLTSDHNRSYQAMPYEKKVVQYAGDNILAQSLYNGTYQNNPQFLRLAGMYGFKPYDRFDKTAIRDRLQAYTQLAKAIWDPARIKKLAGGWDDETEIAIQSGSARRFTVEYGSGRSWEDARKYGFVSAGGDGGTLLSKINTGDIIFCHIAGVGFVGIGICTACEVPAVDFTVSDGNVEKNILDCDWANNTAKTAIDPTHEYFVGVRWVRTVSSDEGYWEKGMTSVPMVAYMMTDESTHNKVLKHFNVSLE